VNLGLFQHDINVLWDLAPHDISILLHVLGGEPAWASAHGACYVQKGRKIHDMAYLTLCFPSGVMATVRLSWLDPVKIRRITVVGSQKMLVYDDIADNKVTLYDRGVEVPPYSDTLEEFQMSYRHGPEEVVPYAWEEPLRAECRDFLRAIRTGQPPCSDAWMGVKVVRVLEAAQRSLLNGGGRELTAV
jgi:predicted dehydrogenase